MQHKPPAARAPVPELAFGDGARHAQAAFEVEEGHDVGAGLGYDEVVGAEHLAARQPSGSGNGLSEYTGLKSRRARWLALNISLRDNRGGAARV